LGGTSLLKALLRRSMMPASTGKAIGIRAVKQISNRRNIGNLPNKNL
jgi:hypothetical protein